MQPFKTLTSAIAIALVATAVHAQEVPAPMSSCVIHTPQKPLVQGKRYEVTFENCSGNAPIQLRYGDFQNLETSDRPACAATDLSKGSCYFTPKKADQDSYTFSTIDASGIETFSGPFKVLPKKSNSKAKKAGSSQKQAKQQKASTQKQAPHAQAMRRKRSLYDIHSFGLL
ncbi:hypothetical protein BGW41_008045 [Actinomortierella wolfii]|nr:hypothetical protein BGW41_008045 [Actinomortierella wolfii]